MDELRKAHAIILTMQRISGYKLAISPFYEDMYKLVITVGDMQVASISIVSTVVYAKYEGRDELWSNRLNSLFTQHGIPNNTWVDIVCNKPHSIAMYARDGKYKLVANTHMILHITEDEFYTIAEVALRKYHP
jgi:hypothetical protein